MQLEIVVSDLHHNVGSNNDINPDPIIHQAWNNEHHEHGAKAKMKMTVTSPTGFTHVTKWRFGHDRFLEECCLDLSQGWRNLPRDLMNKTDTIDDSTRRWCTSCPDWAMPRNRHNP